MPRTPLHPDIDEAMIERLVDHFYAAVRRDPRLGPVFARVIADDDWPPHLQAMMAFWSSVMLMSGRYKGRPVPKHQALAGITPDHFSVWLSLFADSAHAICPPEIAALFVSRAEAIGASLQAAMFDPIRRPAA